VLAFGYLVLRRGLAFGTGPAVSAAGSFRFRYHGWISSCWSQSLGRQMCTGPGFEMLPVLAEAGRGLEDATGGNPMATSPPAAGLRKQLACPTRAIIYAYLKCCAMHSAISPPTSGDRAGIKLAKLEVSTFGLYTAPLACFLECHYRRTGRGLADGGGWLSH
jgi:hypothetical protein